MNTLPIYIPISSFVGICLFFGAVLFAGAQTTTPELTPASTSPQTESQEQSQENQSQRVERQVNDATAKPKLRQEEKRGALSEATQVRVINLAANVSNRVDAAVRRLTNITNRLDSRIQKLAAQGVNTSDAEMYLANAQTTLANISARMNTIDTVVYDSVTSESPRQTWQSVKALFSGVRGDLFAAQEALRAAVAALKQATQEAESGQTANASSSTEELLVN